MRREVGRIVNLAGVIGFILSTVSILALGCEQEAGVDGQTVIIFGTGLSANEKMDALSIAVTQAVVKRIPQFDVISVENPGGTAEAIRNIERYDLCGISLDEAAQAYYGFFAWNGDAHPQLRLLCVMGILPVAFMVAADTGIKSVSELQDKPYGNGGREDMAVFKAAKLLDALKVSPRWNRDPSTSQVDHYLHGRLVGYIEYGTDGSQLSAHCGERPFTVLEISQTELTRAGQAYRGSGLTYPLAMIRAGAYPGQERNITTFGLMVGFYAREGLSSEVAYSLIKAVWHDVRNVSVSYAPLKLDIIAFPKLTLEYGPFPLHMGAVKFYRELGLQVPDRLLPPEMRKAMLPGSGLFQYHEKER